MNRFSSCSYFYIYRLKKSINDIKKAFKWLENTRNKMNGKNNGKKKKEKKKKEKGKNRIYLFRASQEKKKKNSRTVFRYFFFRS